jgi:hypothetical protein
MRLPVLVVPPVGARGLEVLYVATSTEGGLRFASVSGVCCKEFLFLSSGLARGLGVGAGRSMLVFDALGQGR